MGRKKTLLKLDAIEKSELLRLTRTASGRRERERVRIALKASEGCHTLSDLAGMVGRSRSTIQNWLGKFSSGGIAGLLERSTPPGMISPLADIEIQSQLENGLKAGHWNSAEQVANWLERTHGIKRARKSIYYWFQKKGWEAPHIKRTR